MDTITHGLSGSLLGIATRDKFKKIPPKILVYFFTFAAIFPDLDIIFRLISEQAYLKNHRGITHSLLLLPFWCLLLTFIFSLCLKYKIFLKNHNEEIPEIKSRTIFELYVISTLGIIFHILADLITTYGTMILSPYDNTKFAYGSVFIIDLVFTGIILSGIIISKLIGKYSLIPKVAQLFTILLITYVGFTQFLKLEALELAKNNFDTERTQEYFFTILPQPLSPFKWKVFVQDNLRDDLYITHLNLLEQDETLAWETAPKWGRDSDLVPLAKIAWNDEAFLPIKTFFSLPTFHSIQESEGRICLFFQDLKFSNKFVSNPFVYGLCSYSTGLKTIEKLTK